VRPGISLADSQSCSDLYRHGELRLGELIYFGCQIVHAFRISGKAISPFFSTPARLYPAMGCSTTTRDISSTPCSFKDALIKSTKAVVTTVTVGIPFFSKFSWSTTSHEVQIPQSAWLAMTRSGLRWAISAAICSLISPFLEITAVLESTFHISTTFTLRIR
jgi:hypothetical protein